jgi:hypothetical protein
VEVSAIADFDLICYSVVQLDPEGEVDNTSEMIRTACISGPRKGSRRKLAQTAMEEIQKDLFSAMKQ